jgi:hypothetical protein
MILELTGILRDASAPASGEQGEPERQDVSVPRAEDVTIRLTVLRQNGQPADLSGIGSGTVKLVCRKFPADTLPAFVVTAAATDAAVGEFDIVVASAATLPLIEHFDYAYDVELTDQDGDRWQLLPVSRWRVEQIVARPGE